MIKQSLGEEIKTHAQAHKKLKSEFERMHREEELTPARVIKNGSRVCVVCEKSDLWCQCFMGDNDDDGGDDTTPPARALHAA